MENLYKVFIEYENTEETNREHFITELAHTHPELAHQLKHFLNIANSNQEKQITQLLNYSVLEIYDQTNTLITEGEKVGAYRIESLLGHGGMSSVYLAERNDGKFEHKVALKFLSPLLTYNQTGEILNFEAQVLSKLNHPNIARIYGLETTEQKQSCLVIEYVEGQPLNQYLDENTLTKKQKLKLFSYIVEAIQYAHNQQVVHGDIKPENIIIDNSGLPKVIDFGVSRQNEQDSKVIHDYLCALSRGYTSPEQISGKATASVLTDVYALGALLCYILTGYTPIQLGDAECRSPDNNLALNAIINKACHLSTKQRYLTANGIKDDIDCYLQFRPIRACSISWFQNLKLIYKRQPFVVTFSVIFICYIIVGLAGFAYQNIQLTKEQHTNNIILKSMSDLLQQIDPTIKNVTKEERIKAIETIEQSVDWQQLHGLSAVRYATYISDAYHSLGQQDRAISLLNSLDSLLSPNLLASANATYLVNMKLADLYFLADQKTLALEKLESALSRHKELSLDIEDVLKALNTRSEFIEYSVDISLLASMDEWLTAKTRGLDLSASAQFALNNFQLAHNVRKNDEDKIFAISQKNLALLRDNNTKLPALYYVNSLSSYYTTVENIYGRNHPSLDVIPLELESLLDSTVEQEHPEYIKVLSLLFNIYSTKDVNKAKELYLTYKDSFDQELTENRRLSFSFGRFFVSVGDFEQAILQGFNGYRITLQEFGDNEKSVMGLANAHYYLSNVISKVLTVEFSKKHYQSLLSVVPKQHSIPYIAIMSALCRQLVKDNNSNAVTVCNEVGELAISKLEKDNSFLLDIESLKLMFHSQQPTYQIDQLSALIASIKDKIELSQSDVSTRKAYERLARYALVNNKPVEAHQYLLAANTYIDKSNYTVDFAYHDILWAQYYKVANDTEKGLKHFTEAGEFLCQFIAQESFAYRQLNSLTSYYVELPKSCQQSKQRQLEYETLIQQFEVELDLID